MTVARSCALLALAAASLHAQDSTFTVNLDSGETVRIFTRGVVQSKLVGRLKRHDSTTMTFSITKAGTDLTLPWTNVASLEWKKGTDHARGARDGAILGLLFGGLYMSNKYGDFQRRYPRDQVRRDAIALLGVLPVVTTAIGLALGVQRWNRVPLPSTGGGAVRIDFSPEDMVRVRSTLGDIVGRKAVATPDSLHFSTSVSATSLPWRRIGELQMHHGRRRWFGTALGAGGAFLLGALGEGFWDMGWESRLITTALGAKAGWDFAPHRWVSIPQPRQ